MDSDNPSTLLDVGAGSDGVDTSGTLAGTREREPWMGVLSSDIHNQPVEKTCRLGDLHLALTKDKDVAKEHSQRWRSDMEEKIDTQTRKDPGASFAMDGGVPV